MKSTRITIAVIALLVAALGLCLSGCGKKDAATTGEAMTPPAEAGGQPAITQPSESATGEKPADEDTSGPASGGGIGQKLSSLLGSASPPSSYEMKITPPPGSDRKPVSALFKMADRQPVKMKLVNPEGEGWVLMDHEAKAMYMYNAEENKAMKMPLDMDQQGKVTMPGDFVDNDATVAGTETVDGVRCWVCSSAVAGNTAKVWVGQKDGLPRQVENKDGITKFEFLRVNSVPDSEFELPSGVQVVDMKDMMKPNR